MNSDGAGGSGVLCLCGLWQGCVVKLVVVLMLVWCVVLLLCLYGVGAVVWGWVEQWYVVCGGRWRPIKPQETHFSLEGGNCCPNFDSTLVVFYMLTPHSINSLTTLSVIYMHNHSILFCFSSSSNLSHSLCCSLIQRKGTVLTIQVHSGILFLLWLLFDCMSIIHSQ